MMYNRYPERTLDPRVVDAQEQNRMANDGFYGDPIQPRPPSDSASSSWQRQRRPSAVSAHLSQGSAVETSTVPPIVAATSQLPPIRKPEIPQVPLQVPVIGQVTPSSAPNTPAAPSTSPPRSADWGDRGAATIVKSETDENGNVATRLVKKGVKDFEFGETLGEGSYSTVVAASDRQTLREYAIKVLDKRHIIKEKKVKYVNIEKDTLNRLGDHPGIVRLYYTFQDEQSLYFVLDYAANGELLTLIKRTGSLNEDCVRYFGAQLLDAVEFMHSRGVIHRDLKPENILLDYKMRIKVTDFGTAKLLAANGKSEDGEQTYPSDTRASSFVGTAEYLAPELLTLKYNGKACDIWAFGCVLFQMIAGRPPFKASNEYQTFQKIVKLQYSYPPGFPTVLRDLIKRVLILNPADRLSIEKIKAHPFFAGVDWDRRVLWGTLPPRIKPYKSASNPSSSFSIPPVMLQARQLSANKILAKSNISSSQINGSSAATAAAAALSKSAFTIQKQVYDQEAQRLASRHPTAAQAAAAHIKPQLPAAPAPAPPAQQKVSAELSPRSGLKHQQSAPLLQNPSSSLQAPLPRSSQPTRPAQKTGLNITTSATGIKVESPVWPSSDESSPADRVPPLEELPATPLDAEYSSLFSNHDERILKLATLNVLSSFPEEEIHPSRISKFFTSPKRKKRTVIITTAGRLLLVSVDDKRPKLEVSLGNPHIIVREYPFNKKTGLGAISFELQSRMFTIEDPKGTKGWMDSIYQSREYYRRATALSNANAQAALHAATAAAYVGGKPHAPRSSTYSSANYSTSHTSQSSVQNRVINGANSTFLQKNDARKTMRRAR